MQTLTFHYPASSFPRRAARVGVVGSGDLEILCEPTTERETADVTVRTSVDGFDTVWRNVLDRFFARNPVAGTFEINDQGATPGVVSLRLLQIVDAVLGEENHS